MHRGAVATMLAACAIGLPTGLVAQDVRPGIAVLPFEISQMPPGGLLDSGMNFGMQQLLLRRVGGSDAVRIVERRELNRVLREQDLSVDERIDAETAARVGEIVGARYMIGTSLADVFGEVFLTARVIDVETTVIVYTAEVSDDLEEMARLVSDLAADIMDGVDNLPPLPREVREEQRSDAPSMEAIEFFARALDQAESGRVDEAIEILTQTVREFPEFTDATEELRRLTSG